MAPCLPTLSSKFRLIYMSPLFLIAQAQRLRSVVNRILYDWIWLCCQRPVHQSMLVFCRLSFKPAPCNGLIRGVLKACNRSVLLLLHLLQPADGWSEVPPMKLGSSVDSWRQLRPGAPAFRHSLSIIPLCCSPVLYSLAWV